MVNYTSRYRSISDASMRHLGTWVGVIDEDTNKVLPHSVIGVEGEVELPILYLRGEDDNILLDMDDERLIIDRPTLCLVNMYNIQGIKMAVWFESQAKRQIKRSLDLRLLYSRTVGGESLIQTEVATMQIGHQHHREMVGAFFNPSSYPTYQEAFNTVTTGSGFSVAFAEKFSLVADAAFGIALFYKTLMVGHVPNKMPELFLHFDYLKEQLEEITNDII